jgi:hypothetical protein
VVLAQGIGDQFGLRLAAGIEGEIDRSLAGVGSLRRKNRGRQQQRRGAITSSAPN